MDENLVIAYTEVDKIINLMDKKYQEMIPLKLRKLISEKKISDYKVSINPNISLQEQDISERALAILAVLNYNYWCTSDEQKNNLIRQYIKNEEESEKNLKEKYSYDNLFKSKNTNYNTVEETKQLIEYGKKETILQKIIKKIKKWINLT